MMQKYQDLIKEKEKLQRDISELAMKTANVKVDRGQQFVRKLYAPVKEYPDYNFMGLLIGLEEIRIEEWKRRRIVRLQYEVRVR